MNNKLNNEAINPFCGKKVPPEEVNKDPYLAYEIGIDTALLAERYQAL